MFSELNQIEVEYKGFHPERSLDEYVRNELTKVLDSCPYDSSIFAKVVEKSDRFTVEILVRHQLGQFLAFGEEVTLSETLSEALQALSYQLEDWQQTRFLDENAGREVEVLLVDDDPISVILLESCFKQQGCKTKVVTDGEAAVDEVDKHKFDLVVMDWYMPKWNGKKTLSAIDKKMDEDDLDVGERVPVVTYSSSEKSKINFPKTHHLVQAGHLPKTTSYRILKAFVKNSIAQIREGKHAASYQPIV